MTTAPVTATPDEDVFRAARRMLEWSHKRLPVVEDGKVVGIVSRDRRLLEAVVGQVAGVVAVENHLHVRQPEPRSTEDSR